MSRIIYYLALKPLSMLPLSVLYGLSNLLYVVLRLLRYRYRVVYGNLRRVYPDHTPAEIEAIARPFYRHFCDVLVETIRLLSMPDTEIQRRCQIRNLDLLQQYAERKQSIIIAAGHYGNWELAVMSLATKVSHTLVGIYAPLTDPFLEQVMRRSRGRTGMVLVPRADTKAFFAENHNKQIAVLLATDQSPSNPDYARWTSFLGQDTSVFLGTEKYSRKYQLPVVFGCIYKLKRGHYEMRFEELHPGTPDTPEGFITDRHTQVLEQIIWKKPEHWLWTHRRWKRQRDGGVAL